jgi:hypothetical protein
MSDPVRYRCAGCGNVTRFDVVAVRRTRAFHHYSLAGELTLEDETVLDEQIAEVVCRWCGATGDQVSAVAEPSAEAASSG